jgi:wyosine [tRNA(Phe)-imidazoG37] synthetase (radical SAM superfamily)
MQEQALVYIPKKFTRKSWLGKYCLSPFVMIQVGVDGSVRLCGCDTWQPTTVGNILTDSLQNILATQLSADVRQSIIDGTYEYCNENFCGVIQNNGLNTIDTVPPNVKELLRDSSQFVMPYEISFHGDMICNLSCPSCRKQVIKPAQDELARYEEIGDRMYNNLFGQPTDQRIHVMLSGTGEVFASPMLLRFLQKFDLADFPNLALSLNTNGLLAERSWPRIQHIESAVKKITVSIDAVTADTYERLRRGGAWRDLEDSMTFIQAKCQAIGAKLHTRMIIQQANYKEAVEFYYWCRARDVDCVEYSQVTNWGTWTAEEFAHENVFESAHPERANALAVIAELRTFNNVWFEGAFV